MTKALQKFVVATVTVLATTSALAACSSPSAPSVKSAAAPTVGTVKGVLTVTDTGNIDASSQGAMPCDTTSESGYGDIKDGAEVDAVDASGKVLAFASLGPGSTPGANALNNSCAFPFSITGVPRGRKVYGLEFGRRGTVHYKESAMFGGHANIRIG